MAYGIPERAAMIALMALNKETPNAELYRRYGLDVKKRTREKLNRDGLIQSRSLGAKGFVHELTDAGWAWAVAELDAPVPRRPGSGGRALYALLNGLKVALDARGMLLQELFAPAAPKPPGSLRERIRQAYRSLARRPWDWVELRDLRGPARRLASPRGGPGARPDVPQQGRQSHAARGPRPAHPSRPGRGASARRGRHAPDQHGVSAMDPELKALGAGRVPYGICRQRHLARRRHPRGRHSFVGVRPGSGDARPSARRRPGRQPRHPGAAGNRQVALPGTRPTRSGRAGSGLRPLSAQYCAPVLGQSGACLRGCSASEGRRSEWDPVECRPPRFGRSDWAARNGDRGLGGGNVRRLASEGRSPKPPTAPRSPARGPGRRRRGARAHSHQQRRSCPSGHRRCLDSRAGNR